MIREIIVDIREGDDSVRKRILGAIIVELHKIAAENHPQAQEPEDFFRSLDLPKFPGKVIINVFDENEQLIEIIET